MDDLMEQMRAILRADGEMSAILPGGIFDRPLDPSDPITGAAWQPRPGSASGVRMLQPCGVLLTPQSVDDPRGLNPSGRIDFELWPELVFYALASDVAPTLDAADMRAIELLHEQRIGLADVTATGYRGQQLHADELPGDVRTTLRRFRVSSVIHI